MSDKGRIGPETSIIVKVLEKIKDEIFLSRNVGVSSAALDCDNHIPNSDRSLATTRTRIGTSGTLISINVAIVSGTPRVGQVHIRLVLENSNQREKATLCRGYVYPGHEIYGAGSLVIETGDQIRLESRSAVASITLQPRATLLIGQARPGGWTGTDQGSLDGTGAIRGITGTNPAAGAEISETVPTGARWRLIGETYTLVTAVAAATRQSRLAVTTGGGLYILMPSGTTQIASLTLDYYYYEGAPRMTTSENSATTNPIFGRGISAAGEIYSTSTSNLQAADNYSAPVYQVEEWIEQ